MKKTFLFFKDEGLAGGIPFGPLYVVKDGKESNYRDSDIQNSSGGYFAKWFKLTEALRIAKRMKIKLESGSISVEHAFTLVFIAAVVIGAISLLGLNLNSLFERIITLLPF